MSDTQAVMHENIMHTMTIRGLPNLERGLNAHIGFASDYHRCLGSHLARMELVTALDVWHERIRTLVYSGNPRAPHPLPLAW
jgi:cytochrome P450